MKESCPGRRAAALRILACLPVLLLAVPGAREARANSYDNRPKLLVHLRATTTKNACTWGNLSDCTTAVTAGAVGGASGPYYFAYILVATGPLRGADLGGNGLGVAGAQFGIRYDEGAGTGLHVFSWQLCATLEFSSTGWPASGGGNLLTWDNTTSCQRGEVAVAGYFYCGAYSRDELELTPRPVDGQAKVADCAGTEIGLNSELELGCAMFTLDNQAGCNPCSQPCFITPVKPTTWSGIKLGALPAAVSARGRAGAP